MALSGPLEGGDLEPMGGKAVFRLLSEWLGVTPEGQVILCDMGFGAASSIRKVYKDRVHIFGIHEQATISIATGMALCGLKPVVYGFATFIVLRAVEQIRVAKEAKAWLRILGAGAYGKYKKLGPSHWCGGMEREILKVLSVTRYEGGPEALSRMLKENYSVCYMGVE